MLNLFFQLFGWMPPILQILIFGIVSIFFVWSILKIIVLVMDILPFV